MEWQANSLVNESNIFESSIKMLPFVNSVIKTADFTITIEIPPPDPIKLHEINDTSCKDVSRKRHSSSQSSDQSKVIRL